MRTTPTLQLQMEEVWSCDWAGRRGGACRSEQTGPVTLPVVAVKSGGLDRPYPEGSMASDVCKRWAVLAFGKNSHTVSGYSNMAQGLVLWLGLRTIRANLYLCK